VETADISTTKETRKSKPQMKKMTNTFFDIKDIVHFESISQGQSQPSLLCGNTEAVT
jgi:hypothetical protein